MAGGHNRPGRNGAELPVSGKGRASAGEPFDVSPLGSVSGGLEAPASQLAALYRIASALASMTEIDAAFETVAREMVGLLDVRICGIALLDDARTKLTVVAEHSRATFDSAVGLELPLASSNLPSVEVIEGARSVIVDRAQDNPIVESLRETFRARGTEALLIAPLIVRGEVIGTLAVDTDQADRAFGPDDVQLMETVAGQLAHSIAIARLLAEERKSRELAEQLQAAGQAVSQSLDLSAVLSTILDQLERVIECDIAAIQLVEGDVMRVIAVKGTGESVVGFERPLADYPYNRRLATNPEPVILNVEDLAEHWKIDYESLRDVKTSIGLPLIVRDRIIGALTLDSLEANAYTDGDVKIAAAFGRQAAVAIENARLYAAARQELLDRIRIEKELIGAKEAADAASQAKSAFLATMSHELRTPLNAIIGFSDVLMSSLDEAMSERQKTFLQNIHTSGEYLLAIINNVLDLSKIEVGIASMDIDRVDVAESIMGVCGVLRGVTVPRGIDFDLDVSPDAAEIEADPLKFKQILYSMLSNGVKFSPDGSRVSIAVRSVAPAESKLGVEAICVSVEDRGIGINPAQHEAIFREFFQLPTPGGGRPEGAGLGLTLVSRFVELHGGFVKVESVEGEGSRFSIVLPRRPTG